MVDLIFFAIAIVPVIIVAIGIYNSFNYAFYIYCVCFVFI